jgi:PAS domain S-box-containing protein
MPEDLNPQWLAAVVSVLMLLLAMKKGISRAWGKLRGSTPWGMRRRLARVELEQKRSSAALMAILSGSGEAWAWASKSGNVVWVTPGFERLTGRAGSRVMKDGWINAISDEDAEMVREKLSESWTNFEHTVYIYNNGKSGKYRLAMLRVDGGTDAPDGILISLRPHNAG